MPHSPGGNFPGAGKIPRPVTAAEIVMCVIDDVGEPTFEVTMVCSRCGTEISSRKFDVTQIDAAAAIDQLAIADAALGLAHAC